MPSPDFTKYTLALIKNNKLIYSSQESGLKPLVKCIQKYQSQHKNCLLHDKVIGLAAAKLIIYSNMISSVTAQTSSQPAQQLLTKHNIPIQTQKTVNHLLCPLEQKAQTINNNKDFFLEMINLIEK